MRPPEAGDYIPQPRLRIRYIQKHAPYNSGEERVVNADVARKLCILGVAVPGKKRDDNDPYGGWSLNPSEKKASEQLQTEHRVQAGDFAEELDDEEKAREAEEARVEAAATKPSKKKTSKKTRFARAKKPDA